MHLTLDTIFLIAWFCVVIFLVSWFYTKGKQALSIFPAIDTVTVVYRNRFASGYAAGMPLLRRGRANNSLDIVVTDKELWLKTMLMFAGLAQRFGMIHKIPLKNIVRAHKEGKQLRLTIITEENTTAEIVISTKDRDSFLRAIKKQG